jgi:hypothetical protein
MASLQQRLSRLAPSVQTKLYSLFDKGTVSEFCSRGQNGGQNGCAAALVLVSLLQLHVRLGWGSKAALG